MNLLKWMRHKQAGDRGPRITDAHPVRCEALIVEDQQDESDMIKGLLGFQNVIVHQANSIATAMQYINGATRYHLAFVDLNLPDGSGIEVVRRLKESRRMTHVVIVSGQIEAIPLVMSYGYIGLLGKPYTIDSIREILWKHRLPCAN